MCVKRPGAYAVYLALGAAVSFLSNLTFVVLAVYYVQTVGMNPLQLVLVGTALEVAIALFEVPTGVVADTYSRRLSVIIGQALVGVCFVIEGLVPLFAAILLAEFIRGVGETFISGALPAWIADEIGEDRAADAFLRAGQVAQIGALAGLVAGVGLGTLSLRLPIVLGGAALIGVALGLALLMPERGFRPTPRGERTSWQAMGATFRDGMRVVRRRPTTLMLLATSLVYGAFSEGFDRLWEAHFLLNLGFPALGALGPVVWIGGIQIGARLVSIGVLEVAVRRLRLRERLQSGGQEPLARALVGSYLVLMAGVVGLGLAGNFALAVAAFWVATAARTLAGPLYGAWLNLNLDPRVRATVLSIGGQANALGQSAGGPAVGAVGIAFSLRAALVTAGLLLSPVVLLYARALRRGRTAPLVPDASPAGERGA